MITGAHVIVYSRDADADRAFFRDVLKFPAVDAGDGWLIFAMPDSELAVHPFEANDRHELFLLTDDVAATLRDLAAKGVPCSAVADRGWGMVTAVTLPGGGKLGVYQPRHAQP